MFKNHSNCNVINVCVFSFKDDPSKHLMNEIQEIKEKLTQKTQLLEKAKILLSRASAKEKQLKEQVTINN